VVKSGMSSECSVHIIERETGSRIGAVIRPVKPSDKVLWTHWHGELPPNAEDAHWEWDKFMDWPTFFPERFAVYALEAAGELQGLRMLEVSEDEVEQYGVHALRLSTAPWNRPPARRYQGVGSLLVGVAILRSLQDTRGGCIHCESLPGAEAFHENNGMVVFDDLSEDGLRRYRFTAEAGADFLRQLERDALIDLGPYREKLAQAARRGSST
jgi:hypothetical protein